MKQSKILYISYDGMTDPLGQSQVISYLSHLSKDKGHHIHLVSFEKPEAYAGLGDHIRGLTEEAMLHWHPLFYRKRPPVLSTIKDIREGRQLVKTLYRKHNFDIIHCRGYIPMLIAQSLQSTRAKVIFDMRGWWPDEKKESGAWSSIIYQPVYRYFKKLERRFFTNADYIVSLTQAGRTEIVNHFTPEEEKIGVIPTCVNFDVFQPFTEKVRHEVREELDIPTQAKVLFYSGSLGGNYDYNLFVTFYQAFCVVYTDAYFLILSKTDQQEAMNRFGELLPDVSRLRITGVPYHEVSRYIMAGDLGLVLYKDGFSNIGRSPTKLGEYWASGIPAVSLSNIGDVDHLLNGVGGATVPTRDQRDMEVAIRSIGLPADRQQLRALSHDIFSLQKGVDFYDGVYRHLLSHLSRST